METLQLTVTAQCAQIILYVFFNEILPLDCGKSGFDFRDKLFKCQPRYKLHKWRDCVNHLCEDIWLDVYLDQGSVCEPRLAALPGICSCSSLGILISSILKVAATKECSSGGMKAAKQPNKPNGTVFEAISLACALNHSVCHREVYVVCAQSTTTSKLWEGTHGGEGRVLSLFSDSWPASKDPVYNIQPRLFVGSTRRSD